jgi:hypothetical protein
MEKERIMNPIVRWCLFALLFMLWMPGMLVEAAELPEVMFILDGSGSMWGPAGDQTRIEAAKAVMAQVVPGLPEGVNAGLTVYGHRRKGDCADIETLIPCGSSDRKALLTAVQAVSPKGKTPIADSIKLVADSLKSREAETTIVLVSDGEETCHDDPCGVVRALKQSGIRFVLHVVGFGVDDKTGDQLACLAEAGGGRYFSATDAGTLLTALDTVTEEVAEKVEQAKATKTSGATRLGKLSLTMPADGLQTVNQVDFVRVSDGKVVRSVKDPKASDIYPLMAGEYELVLCYANPNYRDADRSPGLPFTITGGETDEIILGAMAFDLAGEFSRTPLVGVAIYRPDGTPWLVHNDPDNGYYITKTRALPLGTWDLALVYGRVEQPMMLARGLEVGEGKIHTVTLDTGIMIKPTETAITGWNLVPSGSEEPLLEVRRRFDNDYPLWYQFIVPAGSYDIWMVFSGSDEPLPVGEGVEIRPGELLEFDSGV